MAAYAKLYDPTHEHENDPLAWPLKATVDELQGLPPHLIVVQELDPIKEEGIEYYRKLSRAGVKTQCICEMGMVHSGSWAFAGYAKLADVFHHSLTSIKSFIEGL